jgi:hypothetical protein
MPTYICVNRGTPRTPRQHCVGDLGGTRGEPTAHDGSAAPTLASACVRNPRSAFLIN